MVTLVSFLRKFSPYRRQKERMDGRTQHGDCINYVAVKAQQ